jgi:hypothetical protein
LRNGNGETDALIDALVKLRDAPKAPNTEVRRPVRALAKAHRRELSRKSER